MPTYSYRCRECGVEFDIQQDFSDAALTECPSCQGPLRKLFSAVGVTFQGSGFYRTDSRAEAKKAPAKSASSSSDSTRSGDSSGSKSGGSGNSGSGASSSSSSSSTPASA